MTSIPSPHVSTAVSSNHVPTSLSGRAIANNIWRKPTDGLTSDPSTTAKVFQRRLWQRLSHPAWQLRPLHRLRSRLQPRDQFSHPTNLPLDRLTRTLNFRLQIPRRKLEPETSSFSRKPVHTRAPRPPPVRILVVPVTLIRFRPVRRGLTHSNLNLKMPTPTV